MYVASVAEQGSQYQGLGHTPVETEGQEGHHGYAWVSEGEGSARRIAGQPNSGRCSSLESLIQPRISTLPNHNTGTEVTGLAVYSPPELPREGASSPIDIRKTNLNIPNPLHDLIMQEEEWIGQKRHRPDSDLNKKKKVKKERTRHAVDFMQDLENDFVGLDSVIYHVNDEEITAPANISGPYLDRFLQYILFPLNDDEEYHAEGIPLVHISVVDHTKSIHIVEEPLFLEGGFNPYGNGQTTYELLEYYEAVVMSDLIKPNYKHLTQYQIMASTIKKFCAEMSQKYPASLDDETVPAFPPEFDPLLKENRTSINFEALRRRAKEAIIAGKSVSEVHSEVPDLALAVIQAMFGEFGKSQRKKPPSPPPQKTKKEREIAHKKVEKAKESAKQTQSGLPKGMGLDSCKGKTLKELMDAIPEKPEHDPSKSPKVSDTPPEAPSKEDVPPDEPEDKAKDGEDPKPEEPKKALLISKILEKGKKFSFCYRWVPPKSAPVVGAFRRMIYPVIALPSLFTLGCKAIEHLFPNLYSGIMKIPPFINELLLDHNTVISRTLLKGTELVVKVASYLTPRNVYYCGMLLIFLYALKKFFEEIEIFRETVMTYKVGDPLINVDFQTGDQHIDSMTNYVGPEDVRPDVYGPLPLIHAPSKQKVMEVKTLRYTISFSTSPLCHINFLTMKNACVVDIEAATQMLHPKNILVSTPPTSQLEKFSRSVGLASSINTDRYDIFDNDILADTVRFCGGVLFHHKCHRLQTDIYKHFSNGDPMKLRSLAATPRLQLQFTFAQTNRKSFVDPFSMAIAPLKLTYLLYQKLMSPLLYLHKHITPLIIIDEFRWLRQWLTSSQPYLLNQILAALRTFCLAWPSAWQLLLNLIANIYAVVLGSLFVIGSVKILNLYRVATFPVLTMMMEASKTVLTATLTHLIASPILQVATASSTFMQGVVSTLSWVFA